MDLKQALEGNDVEVVTLYAQIAYNELGGSYLTEVFSTSDYTFHIINDIVWVLRAYVTYITHPIDLEYRVKVKVKV